MRAGVGSSPANQLLDRIIRHRIEPACIGCVVFRVRCRSAIVAPDRRSGRAEWASAGSCCYLFLRTRNSRIAASSTDRLKQDGVSVKVEELFLAAGEPTSVNSPRSVDAHLLERRMMSDGRDDEPSVVFEANEPAIEEVINTGRQ